MGSSWHFPAPSHLAMSRPYDAGTYACHLRNGGTQKKKPSKVFVGWGGKAPPATVPLWYGKAGVFHYRKMQQISRRPGQGWVSEAVGEELLPHPSGTEPCWIQHLKKSKQANKKGSFTRRHRWVSLLLDRRGEEETLPPWISASWWKWENLAVSPSVRGTVFQHCQCCYRSESEKTQGPRWVGWSVWFGQRPTFL